MSEASPVVLDPPDPPISFPDPPRAELDRRISDLVDAANEVLVTQGRLRALLRANQAIVSELDLAAVLSRVVEAARDLTGARYGALGVVDDRGELDQIVQSGMTEEEVEQIGRLPAGTGLLGAVMHSRDPVRLDDYRTHPRAGDLPPGHPPVHDFLGVPVRVRGTLYGSLYLSGHPRGRFSEEDEQLSRSLASTAGFAIANAKLYLDMRHRQQWAAASAEVTAHLLAPGDGNPLTLVADKVLALADADSVFVTMLNDDPERIHIVEARGSDPSDRLGRTLRLRGSASEPVLRTGEPRRLDEAETRALGVSYLEPFGPLLILPLSTGSRVLGTLVVARNVGRRHFSEADAAMALDFAGRAGVALELHRARADQERVLLFEERTRIARDLHDRVIQQLFATGMQLQSVLGTLPPGRGADRVDAAVSSLDAAIAQIRRVIFTLSSTERDGTGETVRHRLLDLLRELGPSLSLEPALSFTGPVDGVVDAALAEDLLAVVTEAVTNAVKHARASSVSVAVTAGADGLAVVVTNDGPPPAPDGRRSGLANLEERARRRGGSLALVADGGRTALTWTVPLPESTA